MSCNKKYKLKKEYMKERKEHPTLSKKAVETIVKDHMKKKIN